MSVTNTHPEYQENLASWALIRDSIAGQEKIKAAGETYLPRPSGQSLELYNAYKARAIYTMYTARAAEGLYGQIFSKEPEIKGDIPELFEKALNNVDKAGTSLVQFASDVVWDTLQTHRTAVLVDHAPVPEGTNQADKEKADLTSFMRWYAAENITFWQYDIINNKETLVLAVLKEDYSVAGKDKFSPQPKTRYRVLEIVDGMYRQEIWENIENVQKVKEWVTTEQYIPMLDGKPLDYIPLFFLPGKNPEKSMLLPIAYLNIGHYQLDAEYKHLLHYTALPTGFGINVKPQTDPTDPTKLLPITMGSPVMNFVEGISDGKQPHIFYLEPSGSGAGCIEKE